MTQNHQGWLALYSKILLLSLNGLFAKAIPLDATTMSQLRSVIAVLGLLLFCWLQGVSWRLRDWRQALGVYGLGVFLGLHWITYFHAMQVSTVAVGMLALFSYPVLTILLEPLFRSGRGKYRLRFGDVMAGLLVLVGLVVMVWDQLQLSQGSPIVAGCLWGVLSALLFAVRNLVLKHHYSDVPSGKMILHQILAVALMLALFVDGGQVAQMNSDQWLLLLLLGLVTTAGAHTLLAVCLKRLPAKTVSIIGCSQPVLGAVLAWLLLGESVSGWVIAGGAIILSVAIYESLQQRVR
ncbi:DMT family transporter [Porticoccus sp. W117]|uniref:DMT family transporter n=1 Tax=Porticoccus sp. W117 TaxID=3054777 RepID=UPI002597888D|nr:DMT family transporter [Porticoccus sp. W117]MDM3870703.1 DMT family transporter [Porticoccus sp. W117]